MTQQANLLCAALCIHVCLYISRAINLCTVEFCIVIYLRLAYSLDASVPCICIKDYYYILYTKRALFLAQINLHFYFSPRRFLPHLLPFQFIFKRCTLYKQVSCLRCWFVRTPTVRRMLGANSDCPFMQVEHVLQRYDSIMCI